MNLFKKPFLFIITIPLIFIFLVAAIFSVSHIMASRNTVYSEKFTQKGFDAIANGASVEDVKSILGEPFKIEYGVQYVYSKPKEDANFYSKQVIFQDGKVISKFDSLYYDRLF